VVDGRTYASTQPAVQNPETGKKTYRYVHWGTVDEDMKFIPGANFWRISPEERAKLIFPESWDLSEAENLAEPRREESPACDGNCRNLLYGHVWLMEKIADKTGLRQDLEIVFRENEEIVDDILTLAMFPCLSGLGYDGLARWQRNNKTPSSRPLTSAEVARIAEGVSERHRTELLELRASRLGKTELCVVETTSAYDDDLAGAKWGHDQDRLPPPRTTAAVVYDLLSRLPVYYQTFSGNAPDSKTLDAVLSDLKQAGFKNVTLATARGYENWPCLEKLITQNQKMIMSVKLSQKDVAKAMESLGEFELCPKSLTVDREEKIFHGQFEADDEVGGERRAKKKAGRPRVNLYFDLMRRSQELLQLMLDIDCQKNMIEEMIRNKTVLPDIELARRENGYFELKFDQAAKRLLSYVPREEMIKKAKINSGFFALMTHKLDLDAMETFRLHRLRDEQEMFFQRMKRQTGADRSLNSSKDGETGRHFIMFVSLVMSSCLSHVWNSSGLKSLFSSPLDVLEEMSSIRQIRRPDGETIITPFSEAQLEICEAFGFEAPEGCAPADAAEQKPKRKKGRK
jgi:transposase